MIKSKYVYEIDGDNGFYLYNALSGGLVAFDKNDKARALSVLNCGISETIDLDDKSRQLREEFVISEFLVDSNAKEYEFINSRRSGQYCKNSKSTHLKLSIAPTLNCNLNCSYCYQVQDDYERNFVSINEIVLKDIGDFIKIKRKDHESIHITWYGGEPLLALDKISHISNLLKSLFDKEKISEGLITNGTYLDKKTREILKDALVTRLQITIDGNKSYHDARRYTYQKEGTYDTIINNVKEAVDEGFMIGIRVNIEPENVYAYRDVINDLIDNGLGGKLYVHLAGTRYYDNLRGISMEEYAKVMVEFAKDLVKNGFIGSLDLPQPIPSFCEMLEGHNSYSIDPDGNVVVCMEEIGDPTVSDANFGYITGDIDKKKEEFSIKSNWLREIPTECKDCGVLPLCLAGCPRSRSKRTRFTMIDKCVPYKFNLTEIVKLYADSNYKNLRSQQS